MKLSQITRSNIRPLNLNWSAFMSSIVENDAIYDEIANNINVNVAVIEEDSDVVEGILWEEVRQNNKFFEATNSELLDIWYDMQPHIEEQKTRDPKPQVSHIDAFLCSLKKGFDFEQLSTNRNHNDFSYYIPFPIFTQEMAVKTSTKTIRFQLYRFTNWSVSPSVSKMAYMH